MVKASSQKVVGSRPYETTAFLQFLYSFQPHHAPGGLTSDMYTKRYFWNKAPIERKDDNLTAIKSRVSIQCASSTSHTPIRPSRPVIGIGFTDFIV
jgi:hypothetical protein